MMIDLIESNKDWVSLELKGVKQGKQNNDDG